MYHIRFSHGKDKIEKLAHQWDNERRRLRSSAFQGYSQQRHLDAGIVRSYDFKVMRIDLQRYLTDQDYRRQLAQEEQRSRAAAAASEKPANPGMDELQRERTIEGDEAARRDMECRKRARALGRGGLER